MKRICFVFLVAVMVVPVYASAVPVSFQWYEGRNLSYQVGSSYDSYTDNPRYISTSLIPVSPGDTVVLNFGVSALNWYRILFYDTHKTLIDVPYYGGSGGYTFDVPADVSFFALRALPDSVFRDIFLSLDISFIPAPVPEPEPTLLGDVTSIVQTSVHWIASFCICILTNPVLLVSVILCLAGFGVGLIRRLRL